MKNFFFFDWDNNLIYMNSKVILFNKDKGKPDLAVTSLEYSSFRHDIGIRGEYKNYYETIQSHKNFMDKEGVALQKQQFILDLKKTIRQPVQTWQGPSWHSLVKAIEQGAGVAIITARAHSPETIMHGFDVLFNRKLIKKVPNLVKIVPVNNPKTSRDLGSCPGVNPQFMKEKAIRMIIEELIDQYGPEGTYKIGFSDDEKSNLATAISVLIEIKKEYPQVKPYIFDTSNKTFSGIRL